jgi:hypothetical protein
MGSGGYTASVDDKSIRGDVGVVVEEVDESLTMPVLAGGFAVDVSSRW